MNTKTLRESALSKIAEARSADDAAKSVELVNEAKALNAKADALDEATKLEASLSEVRNARELEDVRGEIRETATSDETEVRAFASYLKGETRGQNVKVAADGGVTVPTTIAKDLITSAVDFGPMLDPTIFNVFTTDSGSPMAYATRAGSRRARLVAEGAAATELTGKLGSVTLGAHKMTTDAAVASNELLQDSAIDPVKWLNDELAESVGLGANYELTRGAGGASAPTGICTALKASATVAAALKNSSTAADRAAYVDALLDLQYEVGATYRKRGSYMFSSDVEKQIRKLKDSQGNYILQDGARAGEPATVHGRPYIINDDMATNELGEVSVIFGDPKSYYVRISRQLAIKQLNETYALTDQTGWVGFMRLDGNVVQAKGLAALKNPAA